MEAGYRIVILGSPWSGKSSTGNTILGAPLFDSGRARTLQLEVRRGSAHGRSLTIVDVPGWNYISISGASEASKQNFKLCTTMCLPGPHVFLLVIPLDLAFNKQQGQYVHEYLSLLGDRVWKHVVVVFTCWDYLDKKTTIDDYIRGEGEALQKVLERCEHRFQWFDNKNKTNPDQVPDLLSKIEELVKINAGGFYKPDEKILQAITEKRRAAKEKALQRQIENEKHREKQTQLLREIEQHEPIKELRVVLLGSRNVGKSSTLSTILGEKVEDTGKSTASIGKYEGYVDQTAVKVINTPGWWRSLNVKDTTEYIKQEVMRSVFLCRPGPHVFLLLIDTEASFTRRQLEAVESHLNLLGGNVWKHVIVVFTRGERLREETIEEHIEIEGAALSSLVNKCGNRYHVLRNKIMDDGTQVTELLQKMKVLVAQNQQDFFKCDEHLFQIIEEKRNLVKQRRKEKAEENRTQKEKVIWKTLSEISVFLLGQKTVGKSACGNTILCQGRLPTCFNTECQQATADLGGKKIHVVDTPGWSEYRDECTLDHDKEIIRGLTLSSSGPHAFLLVLPADVAFTARQQRALEDHMVLFGEDVWRHTLVVFTYGDQLGDRTIEEHIMMEGPVLQQLLDKCGNRYHVFNNKNKSENNQVYELLEKIEKMVAFNDDQCYIPNMTEIELRLQEKFEKREISICLEERLKSEKAEMLKLFRDYLSEVLTDLKGLEETRPHTPGTSTQTKPSKRDAWKKPRTVISLLRQSKRTEKVEKKISEKINRIDTELQKSTGLGAGLSSKLNTSYDYIQPSMSGSTRTSSAPSLKLRPKSKFREVLTWLSTMKIEKEDPPSLNYSEASSGYQSILSDVFSNREDQYSQKNSSE